MSTNHIDHLELIKPFYEAFIKHKASGDLTQKELAKVCEIREGDFSAVFGYLKSDTKKQPSLHTLFLFHQRLSKKYRVNETTGLLEKIIEQEGTQEEFVKEVSNEDVERYSQLVKIYPNYTSAQVASGAKLPGEEIYIINTYLATILHNAETVEEDEGTLKNWLKIQNKKIRLLLLRPDGKAMRLRTQTNLTLNGAELANSILSGLRSLLQLQREVPGHLEIKLMDEIPGMAAIIFEQRLYYGLHWSFGHTENGPVFEITNPTHFAFQKIKEHVFTIWNDKTRSVQLDDKLLDQIEHALSIVRIELRYLPGTWNVLMHDLDYVYSGSAPAITPEVTGKISCFSMKISKPDRGIYLKAELHLPDRDDPIIANLITERLGDRDYAFIRFSDFKKLSIHLSFHCRQDSYSDPLLGFFTMTSGSDKCTGTVVLQKVENEHSNTSPTLQISPVINRMLAFQDGAYISLERIRKSIAEFEAPFPYAGTYKVYSYGGRPGAGKCIKINWLYINEFGEALYKNQNFNPIKGRVTLVAPNLHIVFTTFAPQKRRSYLIISVQKALPEAGRFFSGVHLGVSWDDHMPTGKRFVLEWLPQVDFNEQIATIVDLHSPDYKKIPIALRKLLSGRVKNLLGFLRTKGNVFTAKDIEKEWSGSIHLSEVFYDSALQNIQRNDIKNAIEMLFRAVNHGFEDLSQFETEISTQYADKWNIIQNDPDYLKIKKIFEDTQTDTFL